MRRGVRRGCIRLQGAVLGIDDEDDANFTITVDAKVFHLQAKDAEEREIWVMWKIFKNMTQSSQDFYSNNLQICV